MNIGLLAIGFSLICAPVAIYGVFRTEESHTEPQADYQSIYRALAPREL